MSHALFTGISAGWKVMAQLRDISSGNRVRIVVQIAMHILGNGSYLLIGHHAMKRRHTT